MLAFQYFHGAVRSCARSGDLARPVRLPMEEENHDPEPLRRARLEVCASTCWDARWQRQSGLKQRPVDAPSL